ncbi:hypothetical protein ACM66B_006254 [Microbotryomycetes sp. NB124-2]
MPVLDTSQAPLRFVLLGTGSSAAVPDISCATAPAGHSCQTCANALTYPDGPDVRGNTGAVLRIPQADGTEKTVLIDAGKTFRQQALKYFPKLGLRKIDACILTHGHADAIDGLDDLRAWTIGSAIEKTIPVYTTSTTFEQLSRAFPYFCDKAAASGGGAIPSFDWHIIKEGEPLWLFGVQIVPVPVNHGVYFSDKKRALVCLGFLINQDVFYLSDVSFIPESSWLLLGKYVDLPSAPRARSTLDPLAQPKPRLQGLIIDCTGLKLSKSHFGLPQAIGTSRRFGSPKTYLTDIPHGTSHACWEHFCRNYEQGKTSSSLDGFSTEVPWTLSNDRSSTWKAWTEDAQQRPFADVYEGFNPIVEDYQVFTERALVAIEEWDSAKLGGKRPWVRPARDGMTIAWQEGTGLGQVGRILWDDKYH